MKNLILYIRDYCYFCVKVERFIQEQDISLDIRNISESPTYRTELLNGGGKTQTPCLFIDGKAMYESDDIIEWLGNHYHVNSH